VSIQEVVGIEAANPPFRSKWSERIRRLRKREMTAIAPNTLNGATPRYAERGELSHADIEALAEQTAQELLGVPADAAFAMLDRGDLDGKAAEWPLLALRRLLEAA
jgi:hypothetical protein